MPRKPKQLTSEGEPTQTTDKGLEIPIPKRKDFFANLGKVASGGRDALRRNKRGSKK